MHPHRYRASRLSLDAGRQPGAVLGEHQVGQHNEAAESAEEDGSQWDAAADLADSDAGSEASDMPHIMAGDPAEAAAADVYVPFHLIPYSIHINQICLVPEPASGVQRECHGISILLHKTQAISVMSSDIQHCCQPDVGTISS